MEKTILITGISGHLGHGLVNELLTKDFNIRGLLFKDAKPDKAWNDPKNKMSFYYGDISIKDSLIPFFEGLNNQEVYLIHAASYVDIQDKSLTDYLIQTNVTGTKNILSLAKEYGVKRTIYISSVDSFKASSICADENSPYADDPQCGGYALSKVLANKECLQARESGMDVVIIYPTAFIGPYDEGNNHIVQLMRDYLNNGIPGIIKGGYDIADVRDISLGIIKALFKDKCDSSYILSGKVITLKALLEETGKVADFHKKVLVFPTFLAYLGLPFIQAYCSLKKKRPLYTSFALSVIKHANTFNCSKAQKDLGYTNRPLEETIKDTVDYLSSCGQLKKYNSK